MWISRSLPFWYKEWQRLIKLFFFLGTKAFGNYPRNSGVLKTPSSQTIRARYCFRMVFEFSTAKADCVLPHWVCSRALLLPSYPTLQKPAVHRDRKYCYTRAGRCHGNPASPVSGSFQLSSQPAKTHCSRLWLLIAHAKEARDIFKARHPFLNKMPIREHSS